MVGNIFRNGFSAVYSANLSLGLVRIRFGGYLYQGYHINHVIFHLFLSQYNHKHFFNILLFCIYLQLLSLY